MQFVLWIKFSAIFDIIEYSGVATVLQGTNVFKCYTVHYNKIFQHHQLF